MYNIKLFFVVVKDAILLKNMMNIFKIEKYYFLTISDIRVIIVKKVIRLCLQTYSEKVIQNSTGFEKEEESIISYFVSISYHHLKKFDGS